MRPRPSWLLVLLALAAALAMARALLQGPEAPDPASRARPPATGVQGLTGRPRAAPSAAPLPALPPEADGDERSRFLEAVRRRAGTDADLLARLREWLWLPDEDLWALGIDRERVAWALGALGADGTRVLGEAYGAFVGLARRLVQEVLYTLGPDAAGAVAPLLEVASDEERDAGHRAGAIGLLARIGPAAAPATPLLFALLDRGWAGLAAQALVAIEGPTPAVIDALERAIAAGETVDLGTVVAAAGSLGPAAARLAPVVLPLLDDHDGQVRAAAAAALGAFGDASPEIVAGLARLLAAERNAGAGEALARLGAAGREALERAVREGAGDDDRLAALRALHGAKQDLRAHVPELLRIAEADDHRRRREAMALLATMEPSPGGDDLLRWLARRLDDERLGHDAARALVRFPTSEGRAALLAWARAQARARPRLRAASALAEVDPAEALRLVEEAMGTARTAAERRGALEILARGAGRFDPARVLEAVTPHLEDPDDRVRAAAFVALRTVGGRDDEVVPLLLSGIDDPATVSPACVGLQLRPASAPRAVPALLEAWAAEMRGGASAWRLYHALASLGPRWSGTAAAFDAIAGDDARLARFRSGIVGE